VRIAWILLAGAVFLSPFAASPTQAEPHTGNLHNCGDFGSQQEAQQHLTENPSDPDNLDADNDGEACEDYPYGSGGGSASQGSGSTPQSGASDPQSIYLSGGTFGPSVFAGAGDPDDAHGTYSKPPTPTTIERDCGDFDDQESAQSYLEAGISDPADLDDDNDGIACEGYFKHSTPSKIYSHASDVDVTVYESKPNPPTLPVVTVSIKPPSTGDAGLVSGRP
jgi:hypothetical protein